MTARKIIAVITDALGDRVVVGESELKHAGKEHFETLPTDILLELLERILKDPFLSSVLSLGKRQVSRSGH
jgi:hypothetical protein